MKKIIVIPDSFKGSFSAAEFCRIAEKEIHEIFPACRVVTIPAADGGEGTVEAFLTALGGKRVAVPARGPLGEEVPASFGVLPDGTAVIEAAAAAGLPLAGGRPAVGRATTSFPPGRPGNTGSRRFSASTAWQAL